MKNKKDVNVIEKYFTQMNFIIFDVIAICIAAIGALMMVLGLGLSFIAIPIILIGALIKLGALMFEIKDSDFLDMVNHIKELADIDYREKIHFEQYDLSSLPIREGRDHEYRSNHLTISLFSLENPKHCIVELYHINVMEHSFEKVEYKIPYTSTVSVIEEQPIVDKLTPLAFFTVEENADIKIPVKPGSMDLENILEKFGGKQ